MTHTLTTGPGISAADVPASMLAFYSARVGVIPPGVMQLERDDLAGLVVSRPLAELLRSERPIVVVAVADDSYEIRDV